MSDNEIIEYQGRKFVRTGEQRQPVKGDYFIAMRCRGELWEYCEPIQVIQATDHWISLNPVREILREVPAESAAPAGESPQGAAPAQTPCCQHCHRSNMKIIWETHAVFCNECQYVMPFGTSFAETDLKEFCAQFFPSAAPPDTKELAGRISRRLADEYSSVTDFTSPTFKAIIEEELKHQ